VVTIPDQSLIVYFCPRCGGPVEEGEDYMVAREHSLEPDVTPHLHREASLPPVRRFHVEHFRGRLRGHLYELVDEQDSLSGTDR
jgi:hypothetical protein